MEFDKDSIDVLNALRNVPDTPEEEVCFFILY